jgi:predicted Zn-dependent protease
VKQKLYLAVTVLALLCGLALSQWQRVEAPASADALLYWFGDSQRELTRLPMVYTRMEDKDEIAAGAQMARVYRGRLGFTNTEEEKAIQKYVTAVGSRLAARAKRKLPYEFHFVPDADFLNAFAVPGGHVFIGGGLLAQMDSEDELANVLGHEIEHIDHYHCVERLQLELALRKLPMGGLLAIPAYVFQAGYTKEQEFEADREGTALAREAGYSAVGAVRIFEKFERLRGGAAQPARTPQEEISQVARDILRGYFRSHPAPRDRIDQLKRIYAQDFEAPANLRPFEFAYVYIRVRAANKLLVARADKVKTRAAERYREAAELAAKSLALKAGQPDALRILALAQLGLGEYDAAGATYRQLVKLDPADADNVRVFADELANRALAAEEYKDAAALARFSLSLQTNQPAALHTLALAQVGLGEFAAAMETGRKLGSLYPGEGPRLAAQLARRAATAAQDARHGDAVRLHSLAVELDRSQSLVRDLAERQFDAADFSGAARTYESLVAQRNVPADLVMGYAESLAPRGAAQPRPRNFATGPPRRVLPMPMRRRWRALKPPGWSFWLGMNRRRKRLSSARRHRAATSRPSFWRA